MSFGRGPQLLFNVPCSPSSHAAGSSTATSLACGLTPSLGPCDGRCCVQHIQGHSFSAAACAGSPSGSCCSWPHPSVVSVCSCESTKCEGCGIRSTYVCVHPGCQVYSRDMARKTHLRGMYLNTTAWCVNGAAQGRISIPRRFSQARAKAWSADAEGGESSHPRPRYYSHVTTKLAR